MGGWLQSSNNWSPRSIMIAGRKGSSCVVVVVVFVGWFVVALVNAQQFQPSQRFNNQNFNNRQGFSNNNNNNQRQSFNNNNNQRQSFNNNNNNNQQNFNNNNQQQQQSFNNNNAVTNSNNGFQSSGDNFRATPADRRDAGGIEIYPGCNGTVCLPEANLCARRKTKVGHFNFDSKSYWVSWASDEADLRNARWNWFTGRNYCRKMCMDMVSFDSQEEHTFVQGLMQTSNVRDVHTSGRLCDAEVEGCNQTRFQPLNINGWFWASSLKMMPATNVISDRFFNNWAPTGPKGQKQPDGPIKADGFGSEACVALIDDSRYGGLKWHDEPCATRRQIVCEDLPAPNINFVRNQNPSLNIP